MCLNSHIIDLWKLLADKKMPRKFGISAAKSQPGREEVILLRRLTAFKLVRWQRLELKLLASQTRVLTNYTNHHILERATGFEPATS